MEICVDSVESAINAVSGGAQRLELCSALSEGGLTPSLGLFQILKHSFNIPIFIMLRPKGGNDFQYSKVEMQVILQDLALFKDARAHGFVFGALNAEGGLDAYACMTVTLAAQPLPVTFHRAFDVAITDPIETAHQIANLGFTRLLTSGRSPTAVDGKVLIKNLVEATKGRLIIVPGAGIQADNLEDILVTTLAHEFHASAKVLKQCGKKMNLKLGSNDQDAQLYITDSAIVKDLLNVYLRHFKKQ